MKNGIVIFGLASILNASAALAEPPTIPSPFSGDRIVLTTGQGLFEGPLPIGPATVLAPPPASFGSLAFDADGRLLAVAAAPPADPPDQSFILFEIDADGQARFVGDFELLYNENPIDLAFDHDGRLFLLAGRLVYWNPPDVAWRLIELDPGSGAILGSIDLDRDLRALAPAADGLWAVGLFRLFHLDPATGTLTDVGEGLPYPRGNGIRAADVDSTGALWILGGGAGTDQAMWRIDTDTGARHAAAFTFPYAGAMAIRRQCQNTATARCLHGGRFRAQVTWRDFENRSGDGQAARSHTADSALFWFFDASNWELMVKVLNGCGNNDHFWVFAAATTNVAYTLLVTDLETDATWLYDNRLGDRSPAVTDTTAFAICP
jgi:hypothetical protein